MPQSSKAFLDSDLERERKKKKNTHSRCIDSLRIVVDDSRQAKVRYFTHKVAVDEYVPCSQISMDVSHVGEIPHSCCNAPQHSHQLDDCELTIMFLKKKKNQTSWPRKVKDINLAQLQHEIFFFSDVQTLRYICFLVCSEVCTHPEEFV